MRLESLLRLLYVAAFAKLLRLFPYGTKQRRPPTAAMTSTMVKHDANDQVLGAELPKHKKLSKV